MLTSDTFKDRWPKGLRNIYPELVGVIPDFERYCYFANSGKTSQQTGWAWIGYFVPAEVFEQLNGTLLSGEYRVYPSDAEAMADLRAVWPEVLGDQA